MFTVRRKTRAEYDALPVKDPQIFYIVLETDETFSLYLGEEPLKTLPITKGTVSGSGNVVTDITVSGKSVGITKGITAANNNEVVKLSGAQTIAGEKTFNDGIIIPGSNKYIDLGNKNNWFWTRFSGENWSFNNTYTGGGWARNLMEMKDAEGNAYLRIGAQGNSQSFSQMYIGPAYNNYWLSLNNTRALFGTKPQYASDPTDNNDLTRKSYVDDKIDTKVDKVTGKGLSTNDYTTTEKNKLAGIAAGAQVNVGTNLGITNHLSTELTLTSNTGNNVIIPQAATNLAGLLSGDDKAKLNGLATALAGKQDTEIGKGLSTNDYTTIEKNKLAGIAAGAEVNVQSDWNATSGDAFILNKPITMTPTAHNQAYTTINNLPSGRVLGRNSSGTGPTEAITYAHLKSYLSLDNVENKSSETIRGDITQANVYSALGFTPADTVSVTPKLAAVELVSASQTIPNTAANTVYVKTGSSAYTLTLAAGAPIGTQISIVLRRTGNLSIARAGSELINGSSSTIVLNGVNTAVTLVKYDATNWACIGV